jgi:hypothetical protein
MSVASTMVVAISMASSATGAILAQQVTGTTVSGFGAYCGQTVTTPAGGPWDNIKFNFYQASTGNPDAIGGLYALTQAYTGSPSALSTSTAGFLAYTTTINNGVWEFSGLTLNPSTQYFFYMDTTFATNNTRLFTLSNLYTGGVGYVGSNGFTDPYVAFNPGFDWNFNLQGTTVPEPSALSLVGAGVVMLMRRRRRTV